MTSTGPSTSTTSPANGIAGPASLNHRHITEDVPMNLGPIAALGRRHGVSVGAIYSIIQRASIIHRTGYCRHGRTLEKLGLEDITVGELTAYVRAGVCPE